MALLAGCPICEQQITLSQRGQWVRHPISVWKKRFWYKTVLIPYFASPLGQFLPGVKLERQIKKELNQQAEYNRIILSEGCSEKWAISVATNTLFYAPLITYFLFIRLFLSLKFLWWLGEHSVNASSSLFTYTVVSPSSPSHGLHCTTTTKTQPSPQGAYDLSNIRIVGIIFNRAGPNQSGSKLS